MARARQSVSIISTKKKKKRGIAINKNSIGTIHINGKVYQYNMDKVNTSGNFDDAIKGVTPKQKKRKIMIRRK